ncbi:MAG: hypothetical protein AABX07_04190 [Nanoarchaeota archaeon]
MNGYQLQIQRTSAGRYLVVTRGGRAAKSFPDRTEVVEYLEKLDPKLLENLSYSFVSFQGFQEHEEARRDIHDSFRRLCKTPQDRNKIEIKSSQQAK